MTGEDSIVERSHESRVATHEGASRVTWPELHGTSIDSIACKYDEVVAHSGEIDEWHLDFVKPFT